MKDRRQYKMDYIRDNCKAVKLLLNKNTDRDILEFLETVPNKNGFFKEQIRAYIKANGNTFKRTPFAPVCESANFTDTLHEQDLELVEKLYRHIGKPVEDIDYDYSMGWLTIENGKAWYRDEDTNVRIDAFGNIEDLM